MNDDKESEIAEIKQRLDQIMYEHRHCNVTRAKMGIRVSNASITSPTHAQLRKRKKSHLGNTSEKENALNPD